MAHSRIPLADTHGATGRVQETLGSQPRGAWAGSTRRAGHSPSRQSAGWGPVATEQARRAFGAKASPTASDNLASATGIGSPPGPWSRTVVPCTARASTPIGRSHSLATDEREHPNRPPTSRAATLLARSYWGPCGMAKAPGRFQRSWWDLAPKELLSRRKALPGLQELMSVPSESDSLMALTPSEGKEMPNMIIDGEQVGGANARMDVRDPYRGSVIDTVPVAGTADIDRALAAGSRGAREMALLPGYARTQILERAADIIGSREEQLAALITREEGKPLSESLSEVHRIPDLFRLCAFEGTQARGETLPLDANAGTAGVLGIAMRVPAGLIVAITPFNYPLLLVAHKVAPALASGNAVILKPASATPLTALALCQIFLEAGLPAGGLQCLTGPGMDLGIALVTDERVRMVSFTGSAAAGKEVARLGAGKKVTLELGSSCPMVVLSDANMEAAAEAAAAGGFKNAGQACISVQRVIVVSKHYGDFVDGLVEKVGQLIVGDPSERATQVAAMINDREATRVESWVAEASRDGAAIRIGGDRTGAVMTPTVVADVTQQMRIAYDELFGPAVAVMRARDQEHALALANAGHHGLAASLFTNDLHAAHFFARRVEAGNVMINASPLWRPDLMPFGGLGASGYGREGPRYAVEEMTELKTVVFHGVG